MRMLTVVGLAAVLAGCTTASPAPVAKGQTFSGEVWTWDTEQSTVTLLQDGGQTVRVKVTPDQMRTLRHHQRATVIGTPVVGEIQHTSRPAGPVNMVPRGTAEQVEVKGSVTSVEPTGRLAVQTERGPLHLPVAAGAEQRFARGAPVTVRMSLQPVDLVPATAPTAAPTPAPVGDAGSPAGDHAVVTGPVIGVNPGGVLVIESPSGPIQVLAGNGARYKTGDWLQVRTTVRPAS